MYDRCDMYENGDRPQIDKKIPLIICTTLLIEKSPQALPLGAACIVSAINNSEETRNICKAELLSFSMEDSEFIQAGQSEEDKVNFVVRKIQEKNPSIVAFSVFVWNRSILEKVGKKLRKKGIVCIAGGPEVTANPAGFKNFDYVICGEGEGAVPHVVNSIINSNFNLNTSCEIIPSTIIDDLGVSPYLDGTIDVRKYDGVLWELARGCPFQCSYCYESKGFKRVRYIPMNRIIKELDYFRQNNVSQVFVLDPTYNIDKKRAIELLRIISEKTPNTFYYFEARAEYIDRDLARAFTRIPCSLQIGLQSANEDVLKLVKRSFDRKKFIKNINILNEEGVVFGLDLIYGLPKETFQSFVNGIDFALSLYPNNLEIFCLSVLPGTDLYDSAKELKLDYEENPPYHVLHTDTFTGSELKKAEKLAEACNYFYNQGRAVPWFMLLVNFLKLKPSKLLSNFIDYCENCNINLKLIFSSVSHKEIENNTLLFVRSILKRYQKEKFDKVISSLIKLYGALARVQETGLSEKIRLNYRPEYLTSRYIMDLYFFISNIKYSPCTINIVIRNGQAEWE